MTAALVLAAVMSLSSGGAAETTSYSGGCSTWHSWRVPPDTIRVLRMSVSAMWDNTKVEYSDASSNTMHCAPPSGCTPVGGALALGSTDPMDDCIVAPGKPDHYGYGRARVGTTEWKAHRLAWVQANGPIPGGQHVLHRCDNRPCINVAHLFLGTQADNMADMNAKGRQVSRTGDRSGSRTRPESRPRGSRSYTAKLAEADIPVIRRRLAAGEFGTVIALDYGVHSQTIYAIRNGNAWSHVA